MSTPPPVDSSENASGKLPGDRAPALASAVVLATVFGVFGVHAPYFPVWLEMRGLAATEIALTLSLPMMLRPLVTPVLGRLADERSDRRWLIGGLAILTLVLAVVLWFVQTIRAQVTVAALMMLAYQPIQPVADATVGSLVRRGQVKNYGRLRMWGSISFAVLAILGGGLLNRAGIDAVFWFYIASVAAVALAALLLPSAGGDERRRMIQPFRLWRRPALMVVLAVVSLNYASQAMFFAFGSVHMLKLGYPDWSIGLLWTAAVVAEVVVLWFAPVALSKIGPYRLLMIAGALTAIRWLGMALDPPMLGTALLQMLHAGTLSCNLLALMAFIDRLVEEEATARAQSASVTLTGLMMAFMMLVTGPLYKSFGGAAYLAAALLPAAGMAMLLAARKKLLQGK